jgi:hypothetical protein
MAGTVTVNAVAANAVTANAAATKDTTAESGPENGPERFVALMHIPPLSRKFQQ